MKLFRPLAGCAILFVSMAMAVAQPFPWEEQTAVWERERERMNTSSSKPENGKTENHRVLLETSQGAIEIELFEKRSPETVKNFRAYVDEGFFDGTIFHRVISGFMIQGGGFTPDMRQKRTRPPIPNEANNGLKNERGTLAMARTSDIHSATAQFFINLADNAFLDHGPQGYGYAVFGRVVQGMDVVDRIAGVATRTVGGHADVPVEPVVIRSAHRSQPE